jgi:hypothetical protein
LSAGNGTCATSAAKPNETEEKQAEQTHGKTLWGNSFIASEFIPY